MRAADHDHAVQLLTDTQRFVRLVVEREVKGPLEPPQSPRSPLLKGLSPTGYMANRPSKKPFHQHELINPQHDAMRLIKITLFISSAPSSSAARFITSKSLHGLPEIN